MKDFDEFKTDYGEGSYAWKICNQLDISEQDRLTVFDYILDAKGKCCAEEESLVVRVFADVGRTACP